MNAEAARTTEPGIDAESLAREIAAIADSKQAEEIVVLKVGELVSYTDFLIICTARNERLAKAVHDEVRLALKAEHGLIPAREEGVTEAEWILSDYLDCILHVMSPQARDKYRLEQLWGEAPGLELETA